MIELIKDRTNILKPNKFIDDFIDDIHQLKIIKMHGTKRIIEVSFEEALEKVEQEQIQSYMESTGLMSRPAEVVTEETEE